MSMAFSGVGKWLSIGNMPPAVRFEQKEHALTQACPKIYHQASTLCDEFDIFQNRASIDHGLYTCVYLVLLFWQARKLALMDECLEEHQNPTIAFQQFQQP